MEEGEAGGRAHGAQTLPHRPPPSPTWAFWLHFDNKEAGGGGPFKGRKEMRSLEEGIHCLFANFTTCTHLEMDWTDMQPSSCLQGIPAGWAHLTPQEEPTGMPACTHTHL